MYKYRGTDPSHPDNLALRRAMERRLPLIYLVAVDPGYYDAVTPVYVSTDSPTSLEFTLHADYVAWATNAQDSVMATARREYATRAVLQRLHQRSLLTRGHRVLPYCPRCGTVLSSHELALLFEEIFRRYPRASAIGFATIPSTDDGGLSLAAVNRMIEGAVRGVMARER